MKSKQNSAAAIVATLLERGWTDTMIVEVIGWPDVETESPYYPSGSPMKLYGLERVRHAEPKPAFIALLQAVRRRPRKEVAA